jgi:uncharacterized membrane protein
MRLMPWILFIAVFAVAGYWGTLFAIPYAKMSVQMDRFEKMSGGPNMMKAARPGKNLQRPIEKGNPDIQPASCTYDLHGGPVRMRGPVWDGYWSLSFFQANTDNFRILTDLDTHERFDVLIVPKGQAPSMPPPGVTVVESPSLRGIALVRMFVGNDEDKRRAHEAARATSCAAIDDGV